MEPTAIIPWNELTGIITGGSTEEANDASVLEPAPKRKVSLAPTPVTLSFGFQLIRTYRHSLPNIRSALYIPSASTILSLDDVHLNIWQGGVIMQRLIVAPPRNNLTKSSIKLNHENIKPGLFGINKWLYIESLRIYVIVTKQLEVKVLNSSFDQIGSCHNPAAVLSVAQGQSHDIIIGEVGGIRIYAISSSGQKFSLKERLYITLDDQWPSNLFYDRFRNRVFVSCESNLHIFDLQTGSNLENYYEMHSTSITCISFYEPLEYLITGSKDGSINVRNNRKCLVFYLHEHLSAITGLLLVENIRNAKKGTCTLLISASLDATIRLMNFETGQSLYRLDIHEPCLGLGLLKKNHFYHYGASSVQMWNLNQYQIVFAFFRSKPLIMRRVEYKRNVGRILTATSDGNIKLLSPVSGCVIGTGFPSHNESEVKFLAYNIKRDLIFCMTKDDTLISYDCKTNPFKIIHLQSTRNKSESITSFCEADFGRLNQNANPELYSRVSHESKLIKDYLLFKGTSTGQIHCVDVEDNYQDYLVVQAHSTNVEFLKYDQTECHVVSGSSKSIKIWAIELSLERATLSMTKEKSYFGVKFLLVKSISLNAPILFNSLEFCWNTKIMGYVDHGALSIINYQNESQLNVIESDENQKASRPIATIYCKVWNQWAVAYADCHVRIYDKQQLLIREIQLPEQISCLCYANGRGDLLVGLSEQIVLIRLQDYMPNHLITTAGNMCIMDDSNELPIVFDPEIEFWQHKYQKETENKGQVLTKAVSEEKPNIFGTKSTQLDQFKKEAENTVEIHTKAVTEEKPNIFSADAKKIENLLKAVKRRRRKNDESSKTVISCSNSDYAGADVGKKESDISVLTASAVDLTIESTAVDGQLENIPVQSDVDNRLSILRNPITVKPSPSKPARVEKIHVPSKVSDYIIKLSTEPVKEAIPKKDDPIVNALTKERQLEACFATPNSIFIGEKVDIAYQKKLARKMGHGSNINQLIFSGQNEDINHSVLNSSNDLSRTSATSTREISFEEILRKQRKSIFAHPINVEEAKTLDFDNVSEDSEPPGKHDESVADDYDSGQDIPEEKDTVCRLKDTEVPPKNTAAERIDSVTVFSPTEVKNQPVCAPKAPNVTDVTLQSAPTFPVEGKENSGKLDKESTSGKQESANEKQLSLKVEKSTHIEVKMAKVELKNEKSDNSTDENTIPEERILFENEEKSIEIPNVYSTGIETRPVFAKESSAAGDGSMGSKYSLPSAIVQETYKPLKVSSMRGIDDAITKVVPQMLVAQYTKSSHDYNSSSFFWDLLALSRTGHVSLRCIPPSLKTIFDYFLYSKDTVTCASVSGALIKLLSTCSDDIFIDVSNACVAFFRDFKGEVKNEREEFVNGHLDRISLKSNPIVLERVASCIIDFEPSRNSVLLPLISLLNEPHERVIKAAMASLSHFGINSRYSLRSALENLGQVCHSKSLNSVYLDDLYAKFLKERGAIYAERLATTKAWVNSIPEAAELNTNSNADSVFHSLATMKSEPNRKFSAKSRCRNRTGDSINFSITSWKDELDDFTALAVKSAMKGSKPRKPASPFQRASSTKGKIATAISASSRVLNACLSDVSASCKASERDIFASNILRPSTSPPKRKNDRDTPYRPFTSQDDRVKFPSL